MSKPLVVSDHALLRYIERVKGIDLERLRAEILKLVHHAAHTGARKVSVGGFTYCINDRAVVTIIAAATPNGAHMKSLQHRGRSIRMHKDART